MITTTVETITPEIAKKMLEVNRHNRTINYRRVVMYARDMRAGKWLLTHQGIAFGEDGDLLDGQHRLLAVIEAGVPVRFTITRGLDKSAQMLVDKCLPRSDSDCITLGGRIGLVSKHEVAVARVMPLGIVSSPGRSGRNATMTMMELESFIDRHRDAIRFSIECLPRSAANGLSAARLRAVVARSWYTEDRTDIVKFCEILITGRSRSDRDDIVITLRNWITGSVKSATGSAQSMLYGKAARALLAYLRDERIKNLIAATTNVFPLPEEMDKPI